MCIQQEKYRTNRFRATSLRAIIGTIRMKTLPQACSQKCSFDSYQFPGIHQTMFCLEEEKPIWDVDWQEGKLCCKSPTQRLHAEVSSFFILIFVADQVSDLKLFGLNCGVFVLNAIEKGDFLLLTWFRVVCWTVGQQHRLWPRRHAECWQFRQETSRTRNFRTTSNLHGLDQEHVHQDFFAPSDFDKPNFADLKSANFGMTSNTKPNWDNRVKLELFKQVGFYEIRNHCGYVSGWIHSANLLTWQ